MAIPYKPKTIIAMLVTAVIAPFFSYLCFQQLEYLINHDLYNYGLVFSNNWSDLYSFYASLYTYFLLSIWFLLGGSILSFLAYDITKRNGWRSVSVSFLVFGTILNFFNIYIFYRLDSFVNTDLYLYGLSFSSVWYSNYISILVPMLFLAGLEIFITLASAILINGSTMKKKRAPARLFDSILIAIGTAILSLSIIYSSSILALIGLGLLFWGVTFTYITSSDYVKKVLFDTTVIAQQETLNRVVQKLEYRGDTIYLPPQFFNTTNIYKAYISRNKLETPPTADLLPNQKPDFLIDYIEKPAAVLITPPGVELTQLFEKTLEKDFVTTSLQDLQSYLPELLIDELEITSYFDMKIEENIVRVQIDDSYFRFPRAETELSSLYFFFESPLICAIAFVFAKATGAPVIIERSKTETKGKVVNIAYHLLKNEL
jgi:hypothetical protein